MEDEPSSDESVLWDDEEEEDDEGEELNLCNIRGSYHCSISLCQPLKCFRRYGMGGQA